MEVLQKIKNPLILILGIYSKKINTLIRKDICTPVINAALFTTAKIRKQPKSPSMDECLKKMWVCGCVYAHTRIDVCVRNGISHSH